MTFFGISFASYTKHKKCTSNFWQTIKGGSSKLEATPLVPSGKVSPLLYVTLSAPGGPGNGTPISQVAVIEDDEGMLQVILQIKK